METQSDCVACRVSLSGTILFSDDVLRWFRHCVGFDTALVSTLGWDAKVLVSLRDSFAFSCDALLIKFELDRCQHFSLNWNVAELERG